MEKLFDIQWQIQPEKYDLDFSWKNNAPKFARFRKIKVFRFPDSYKLR